MTFSIFPTFLIGLILGIWLATEFFISENL